MNWLIKKIIKTIKGNPVSRLGCLPAGQARKQFRFMLLMIIVFAAPGRCFGLGLEVDPGEINIQDVSLGQRGAVSALGGERMKSRVRRISPKSFLF